MTWLVPVRIIGVRVRRDRVFGGGDCLSEKSADKERRRGFRVKAHRAKLEAVCEVASGEAEAEVGKRE